MTTTEDDFTFIPQNYLFPKSISNTHIENIFAEDLKTLSEQDKPALLAPKQTLIDINLREINQR
eukprot:9576101-Ditylum_brightwellii.AAC.1